jgi:hypothetical protein
VAVSRRACDASWNKCSASGGGFWRDGGRSSSCTAMRNHETQSKPPLCSTAMKKLRIVILAKVWRGATETGPWMMDKSKTPRHYCRSCRYLTLCRGVLDLSIIQ